MHKAFARAGPTADGPRRGRAAPARGRWLAAAAAVLLLAAGTLVLLFSNTPPTPGPTPPVQVATWQSKRARSGSTASASSLADQVLFEVVGDEPAVIRMADGSRAELLPGPAACCAGAGGPVRPEVELAEGEGKFSVPKGQGQFRVETAVATVTVVGTEFTVNLQPVAAAGGRLAAGRDWVLTARRPGRKVQVEGRRRDRGRGRRADARFWEGARPK